MSDGHRNHHRSQQPSSSPKSKKRSGTSQPLPSSSRSSPTSQQQYPQILNPPSQTLYPFTGEYYQYSSSQGAISSTGATQSSGAGPSSSTLTMPAQFNRVRVEDLLNAEIPAPSRGPRPGRSRGSESDSPPRPRSDYRCSIGSCTRRFPSRESLNAHQKRSHPTPTAFVCEHCGSSFSTAPNLNKHIRSVHEKVKPFKCEKCKASFAFRDGLRRHTRMVHEQVRPYPCEHCNLRFKTKSHLWKHSYALHPEKHGGGDSGAGSSTGK